jgi:hypothetical protein
MGLHLCLHAQTLNDPKGEVSGSELTTLGLQRALLRHPDVSTVLRVGPLQYDNLGKHPIDLVIIEGWNIHLPQFISLIHKYHPKTKILFWSLSYYGFKEILCLPIDGYLTNSQQLLPTLETQAPTQFLHLAADPAFFRPMPPINDYAHEVTYLGHYRQTIDRQPEFEQIQMLTAASLFDLGLYGFRWEEHSLLSAYHRGTLPLDQMSLLYSSSKIVLGTTENRQRKVGMINNRIFEALACGACVISDHSNALEAIFGDLLIYAHTPWEALQLIKTWLPMEDERRARSFQARDFILNHHTYDHRIPDLLNFYNNRIAS